MNCVRYLQNNVCLIFYSIFFSFLCLIPFVPSVTLMWLFSVYTHCSVCTFSLHPLFMSQQQYCQHIIISITSLAKPLIFSFNLYIFKNEIVLLQFTFFASCTEEIFSSVLWLLHWYSSAASQLCIVWSLVIITCNQQVPIIFLFSDDVVYSYQKKGIFFFYSVLELSTIARK